MNGKGHVGIGERILGIRNLGYAQVCLRSTRHGGIGKRRIVVRVRVGIDKSEIRIVIGRRADVDRDGRPGPAWRKNDMPIPDATVCG